MVVYSLFELGAGVLLAAGVDAAGLLSVVFVFFDSSPLTFEAALAAFSAAFSSERIEVIPDGDRWSVA